MILFFHLLSRYYTAIPQDSPGHLYVYQVGDGLLTDMQNIFSQGVLLPQPYLTAPHLHLLQHFFVLGQELQLCRCTPQSKVLSAT